MGTSTYFGFPGGLYPDGNVMPQAHTDAGQAFAATVEPLNANGNPSTDGRYILLSIGFSGTQGVFCDDLKLCTSYRFAGQAMADADVDRTNLAIVNGALNGALAPSWAPSNRPNYDRIRDELLSPLGMSEQQVQVVWMQAVDVVEPVRLLPLPSAPASVLVRQMGDIVRALRSRYPNLRLLYLSNMVYGGFFGLAAGGAFLEPFLYENGFAMKWLIEAQIDQMASGGTIVDERAGDLNYNSVVPWIGWGPYLWADGVNPRSDGLFWSASDYDGGHQSEAGLEKAAALLLAFFKTSPQARCWFVTGETC